MTQPKHTPGPWHRNIKPARKYTTVFADKNKHICYLDAQVMSDGEAEANINLITAAPELLEVLEMVNRWASLHGLDSHELISGGRGELPVMAHVRAAIAKARGAA